MPSLPVLVAVMAGAMLPLQAAINARLARAVGGDHEAGADRERIAAHHAAFVDCILESSRTSKCTPVSSKRSE